MSKTIQSAAQGAATAAITYEARAYAALSASAGLATATLRRRGLLSRDVQTEVLFCDICHSEAPLPVDVFSLLLRRRQLAGSLIGGIRQNTASGQTLSCFPSNRSTKAYDRLVKSDVKYRFVIDTASVKGGAR